jgi:hypothetical protein
LTVPVVDAVEHELADNGSLQSLNASPATLPLSSTTASTWLPSLSWPLPSPDVDRAGQVVDDAVEQALDALLLEGRTGDDAEELERDRRLADGEHQVVDLDLVVGQVLLGEVVVEVRDGLDQLVAVHLRLGQHVLRDRRGDRRQAERVLFVVEEVRDHLHQVDDAGEVLLGADRQEQRVRVALELRADVVDRPVEVGADAVHLIDEGEPGDVVLVGLAPDRLRLGLHARNGVEHRDRAVEDAQGALDLGREVHVAGRVDDVDALLDPLPGADGRFPGAGDGGRGDRDAALALLLHPVGDRGAVVDLAHLVDGARVKEDALGRGRLARVDVGRDADVARPLKRERARRRVLRRELGLVGDDGNGRSFDGHGDG